MTTIQDRRREVENTINRLTAQRDGCIANLCRYEAKLKVARRKLERVKRGALKALEVETERLKQPAAAVAIKPAVSEVTDIPVTELPIPDKLEIPDFLRRPKPGDSPKDIEALRRVVAEQAERKRAKARGRIDTMKAKQRGDTAKMPLEGKAALRAINAFVAQETK